MPNDDRFQNDREFEAIRTQYRLISQHFIYENQLKITLFGNFLVFNGIMAGVVNFSGGLGFKLSASLLGLVGSFVIWLMMTRSYLHTRLRESQMQEIERGFCARVPNLQPVLSVKPRKRFRVPGGIPTTEITRWTPLIGMIIWGLVFLVFMLTEVDLQLLLKSFFLGKHP